MESSFGFCVDVGTESEIDCGGRLQGDSHQLVRILAKEAVCMPGRGESYCRRYSALRVVNFSLFIERLIQSLMF